LAFLKRSIFFVVAFWVAWKFAALFEVYPYISAFYIPPGLSVAFISIFGWRYIPVIFIAAILSALPDIVPWELRESDLLHSLRQSVVYGIAGHYFQIVCQRQSTRFSLSGSAFLFAISLGASLASAVAARQIFDTYDLVPDEALATLFLSFWGGDFAGVMLTTPIIVFLIERQRIQDQGSFLESLKGLSIFRSVWFLIACALFSSATALLSYELGTDVRLEIFTVIPVTFTALVFGVPVGIIATILSTGTLIAVHAFFSIELHQAIELQVLLGVSASLALIAGGLRDDRLLEQQTREKAEFHEKEAMNKAAIANRAKSELLANMSHELRTPLNAIIGFSESMKEETFGPVGSDKNREYLDDIYQSGQHLLGLINDILDVSTIEAGALELEEENVNITDVVEASVRLIRPRADNGQMSITSTIDPEIPLIYADARRVKQVFLNLLSNAVKFTPESGEVTVSAQLNDDGSLAVAVADNGIGMDEEEVTKALSTFGQVDSGLDRKHEGTGLGLPLTKGLMELHGGTLEIESEKGYGSLVMVTFPKERVVLNV